MRNPTTHTRASPRGFQFFFKILHFCLKNACCCSVVSDSLRPHGLRHARCPCPSPSPGVCSNSRLSSQTGTQHSHMVQNSKGTKSPGETSPPPPRSKPAASTFSGWNNLMPSFSGAHTPVKRPTQGSQTSCTKPGQTSNT